MRIDAVTRGDEGVAFGTDRCPRTTEPGRNRVLATQVGPPISLTHARVGGLLDPLARFAREQLGVTATTCVCLGPALSR